LKKVVLHKSPPPDGWDSGNSPRRGVKDTGNPSRKGEGRGGGGALEKAFFRGHFDQWFTQFSSVTLALQSSQTIVEIFCSHISHPT